MSWLLIALGGALGTVLRHGLSLLAGATLGTAMPWGTFLANALGSFALGIVVELGAGRDLFGTDARLVLGVGLMGGFTTYSSFNLETLRLVDSGLHGRAALYVAGTLLLCLLGGLMGLAVAKGLSK